MLSPHSSQGADVLLGYAFTSLSGSVLSPLPPLQKNPIKILIGFTLCPAFWMPGSPTYCFPRTMRLLLLALPVLALLPQVIPGNRSQGSDHSEGLMGPSLWGTVGGCSPNTASTTFLAETVSGKGGMEVGQAILREASTARVPPRATCPPKEQG